MVQVLDIDFQRRPRLSGSVGWLLLAAGLLLSALAAADYLDAQADLAHGEHRLSRAKRAAATAGADRRAGTGTARQLRELDRWQSERSAPWDALLRDIETEAAQRPAVAMLSFTARASTRQAQLTGEARSLDDLLAFARALGRRPALRAVLLSEHALAKTGPVPVVRFTIDLQWETAP